MKRHTPWLVLDFVFLAAHPCFPWSGECVGISEGDTIRVMHLGKAERLRLFGIDCPERGQDFSRIAKWFTSKMVFDKVVDVEPVGMDRYGRTVEVLCPVTEFTSFAGVQLGSILRRYLQRSGRRGSGHGVSMAISK